MENAHSPAAERIRRIRADRQRIKPHIGLMRGIAAGKPPATNDVYHVHIALLLVRREEARADDLPTATLNLLSELSREANHALRRILLAVAGEMGPLAQSQNWDALMAEIGHGESAVWQMLREAVERVPAPDDGKAGGDQDWMLVSEAVAELPGIPNLKALYRYAKKHPEKLRLRDHPHHKKRRQAHRADVQRLVQEHNEREFAAMDGTAADDLPSISDAGIEGLAARMAAIRQKKTGK